MAIVMDLNETRVVDGKLYTNMGSYETPEWVEWTRKIFLEGQSYELRMGSRPGSLHRRQRLEVSSRSRRRRRPGMASHMRRRKTEPRRRRMSLRRKPFPGTVDTIKLYQAEDLAKIYVSADSAGHTITIKGY